MKTETRLPEYQDRVTKDSLGVLYQGERVVNLNRPGFTGDSFT